MNNSKTILSILLQNIQNKGITEKECLKMCSINTSFLTDWKSDKIKNPSIDKVVKLANFLDLDLNELLLGINNHSHNLTEDENSLLAIYNKLSSSDKTRVSERAETLAELAAERAVEQAKKSEETAQSSADPRPAPQKPLPFPTELEKDEEEKFYVDICSLPASAGTGVYLDDSSTEPLQIVHTDIAERANYAVRVSGDSMMPEYNDGDIVLVETCRSVEVGEIGIFVVDGEGYIKKYGGDRLISLNSKYKDMLLKRYEAVYCRGRVLGIAEVVD